MALRLSLMPIARLVLQPLWRMTRGQTLGVRGVARNDAGHILLIRHSYAPGWMFPGGGVERGDTLEAALAREFEEEIGVTIAGRPHLFGVYANFDAFPGDHVALFVVDGWRGSPRCSLEIAEWGFFDPESLPEGTTGGTRRRLAEMNGDAERNSMW
jgi:8-oxo-dGTP pyrophosphatase MutT (NUDIX family)